MKGTKILWGQVVLVGAVVLAFVWSATEWTAWRLAFQPELGGPWFALFGWPLYAPPAFFWWWFAYDAYAPEVFVQGAYIAASGAIAGAVVAVTMSVWRAREAKSVTTDGSARWAESREIRHAGLFHAEGVVLGRWRGAYLRHDGPEHVLCFAPTRSGKGVGLVVPTLLTWPESAIVPTSRERTGP
jgi:type IV secretion system protein VirD4